MDSVLRPRDIQARIRAGETPEDVAAAAQTTVDKIMGFATPVLAERAYQAQLAQRASVRRRAAAGQVGNLGSAVTSHLEALDVDPESVEWDAWRREDGRWTVVAGYVVGSEHHQAAFAYDAAGRFVIAEDDEARTLVGERSAPPVADVPERPADPVGSALDDLLVPRETPAGEQLPLGDDALSLVTGRRQEPVDWSAVPAPAARDAGPDDLADDLADDLSDDLHGEVTLDLSETASAVRAAGPSPAGDADWISTQASERPEPPAPPAPRPEEVPGSQPSDAPQGDDVEGDAREEEKEAMTLFEVPAPRAEPGPASSAEPRTESSTESNGEEAVESAPRPTRASRSRGRASVPSWDEIMFGTPKSE